ncbi:MAG TPA: CAP domain-containing protein [Chthoniobacterales bacterium]|nr:CAP domain-containing protein [Chthoniobacterales bacterium]
MASAVLMEIIVRRVVATLCFLPLPLLAFATPDHAVSGIAIIRELNLARQNPRLYASFVEQLRRDYNGRCLFLPGGTRVFLKEGTRSVDDAIRFLRSTSPLQPLTYSTGMSRGAADHCADQANGRFSHTGRDGSDPGARISRYGTWGVQWGENVAYGKFSARDIVLALIIDDGLPARKHRKNIFNTIFNYAGAAYGPHAKFGSVCTMDFAGAYVDRHEGGAFIAKF